MTTKDDTTLSALWRDIESAPKDDGWFLAASAGGLHIVCIVDGEMCEVGAGLDGGAIRLYRPAFEFTHWMPFPDPPAAPGASSGRQDPQK